MKDYCEYSHDLPPSWTQLTVKLSHKEKPCPVINLDDSYRSVFLHSQFGMREKIRPQQLVGLLYPFIARFVGSSQQFQPDEQRLLFGPLRRHNEIVREQDRLRIFAPKSQFLLLDLIGMRRSDPISGLYKNKSRNLYVSAMKLPCFFFNSDITAGSIRDPREHHAAASWICRVRANALVRTCPSLAVSWMSWMS
jgi:hypothetical protein